MKVLGMIKKIILSTIIVIYFAFVIFMTVLLLNYNKYGVTQFGDSSLIIMRDEISTNDYKKGDLIIVKSKKISNIQIGDDIFTYQIAANGEVNIDLGKVGEIHEEEDAITYENGSNYSMEFVIGSADKVYENVGNYLSIIESKWGFLFIVLVPSFLIFIYEVYNLIVEIKYGAEDDD